jgi:hypothetical protein
MAESKAFVQSDAKNSIEDGYPDNSIRESDPGREEDRRGHYIDTLFDTRRAAVVRRLRGGLYNVCVSKCGSRVAVLGSTQRGYYVRIYRAMDGAFRYNWRLPIHEPPNETSPVFELQLLNNGCPCVIVRGPKCQIRVLTCRGKNVNVRTVIASDDVRNYAFDDYSSWCAASVANCGTMVAMFWRCPNTSEYYTDLTLRDDAKTCIGGDLHTYKFAVYQLHGARKMLGSMYVIAPAADNFQFNHGMRWSADSRFVAITGEAKSAHVFVLGVTDQKQWVIPRENGYKNHGTIGLRCGIGYAIHAPQMVQTNLRCYDYCADRDVVYLNGTTLDVANQLTMATSISRMGLRYDPDDFDGLRANLTPDGAYLITLASKTNENVGGPQRLWIHELSTNCVQTFADLSPEQIDDDFAIPISIAESSLYAAFITRSDFGRDEPDALRICPRVESQREMVKRTAWMVASVSLSALRATRAHPLRNCLLRPDTLGAITAMVGALAGAAPCAKAEAVLKRVAPLAQHLPDTRWGAAQIAQPTSREMDAYIESLWE